MPVWLMRGRAYFKQETARLVSLDVKHLPYNDELLTYLKAEHASGRDIYLATASSRKIAFQIAHHLGIFRDVFASDRRHNLAGREKAKVLEERFGYRQFVYAGNSYVDFAVWKRAAAAIVVNAPLVVERNASTFAPVAKVFARQHFVPKTILRAMRVHQWSKNLLIFLPLLLANRLLDFEIVWAALVAFLSFSLVASSVYLVNDLLDLDADRLHPDNRRRPFAAGTLPLSFGFVASPVLLLAGFWVATLVNTAFMGVLAAYYVATCFYTFYLKRLIIADILTLAGLYAIRVFAGAIATGVALSSWFLVYAGFIFLSLALVKRCSELILMEKNKRKKNSRRGYTVEDLPLLMQFGVASGYLSVLVLAFYLKAPEIAGYYTHPKFLWLICPFSLYWISRMWLLAHRGKMHTDPLVFTLRDQASYVIVLCCMAIWVAAVGFFG